MKPDLVFGTFILPTFYVVIIAATLIILFLLHKRLIYLDYISKSEFVLNLTTLILISAFVGARLTHVLYEEPQYYYYFWPEIFKFWKGGFVYFGGFILAFIVSYFYIRSQKESVLFWVDFFTPFISLSYALGRIGCFFEGCCYGIKTDSLFAINHRHPTQIYMSLAEFLLLAFVIYLLAYKSKNKITLKANGQLFFIWLSLHATTRFFIEFLRDDDRGPVIDHFTISQIISVIFILISIYTLKKLSRKTK